MRWFDKFPEINDLRIVKKFALLPVTIGKETRWLEKVKIEQRYIVLQNSCSESGISNGWIDIKFMD